jgi:hypothetical protein
MPYVVAAFLEAATVDGLDTSCLATLTPPTFSISG